MNTWAKPKCSSTISHKGAIYGGPPWTCQAEGLEGPRGTPINSNRCAKIPETVVRAQEATLPGLTAVSRDFALAYLGGTDFPLRPPLIYPPSWIGNEERVTYS